MSAGAEMAVLHAFHDDALGRGIGVIALTVEGMVYFRRPLTPQIISSFFSRSRTNDVLDELNR